MEHKHELILDHEEADFDVYRCSEINCDYHENVSKLKATDFATEVGQNGTPKN